MLRGLMGGVKELDSEFPRRSMMKAEYEKVCRDLVAYIAQPMSDEERAAHVQGVGKFLRAKGGAELMSEAYEMVRGLGADMKLFDQYWRAQG